MSAEGPLLDGFRSFARCRRVRFAESELRRLRSRAGSHCPPAPAGPGARSTRRTQLPEQTSLFVHSVSSPLLAAISYIETALRCGISRNLCRFEPVVKNFSHLPNLKDESLGGQVPRGL